jgi:hypothetical protein
VVDKQLIPVSRRGSLKPTVLVKKADDLALPGTGPSRKLSKISLREWPEPSPVLAQHVTTTRNNLLDTGLASKKAVSQLPFEV